MHLDKPQTNKQTTKKQQLHWEKKYKHKLRVKNARRNVPKAKESAIFQREEESTQRINSRYITLTQNTIFQ